jgi:hypothetical protein
MSHQYLVAIKRLKMLHQFLVKTVRLHHTPDVQTDIVPP